MPAANTNIPDDHGEHSINSAIRDIDNACAAAAANTSNSSSSTSTWDDVNNTACSSHVSIPTLPFSNNTNTNPTRSPLNGKKGGASDSHHSTFPDKIRFTNQFCSG